MLSTQGYRVLPFQLTETLLVLTESNERAVEASIGGGELDLPIMRRENQDYADGITSIGGRWQDMIFAHWRQGSGGHTGYGSGGGRTLALVKLLEEPLGPISCEEQVDILGGLLHQLKVPRWMLQAPWSVLIMGCVLK
ncbi:hypothetical protein SLE2022_064020 [Rubroshorea leprosula]